MPPLPPLYLTVPTPFAAAPPAPPALLMPMPPPWAPTEEVARLVPLSHVSPPALPVAPPVPTWIVTLLPAVSDKFVILEYPAPPPPDPA